MSGLNPGREWLALPQSLLGGCRHCNETSPQLSGAERLTDMVAVGTPAAMDVYARPYDETHVDSLPLDTENYITLVMRNSFIFRAQLRRGTVFTVGRLLEIPFRAFLTFPAPAQALPWKSIRCR
jgi:hypothetical protein